MDTQNALKYACFFVYNDYNYVKGANFMKKKSLLFFPILGAFLLAGCELQIGSWRIGGKKNNNSNTEQKQEEQQSGDQGGNEGGGGTTPEDIHTHATSMSMDPNAPFYLKVGETKTLTVTLSPTPEIETERECTWSLNGNFLTYEVNSSNSRKVDVTGTAPGTAKLTATNTYNSDLTKTFTIKVVEFDEAMDYMWQYQSSDRAQFGYVYQDKPEGNTEGDALLNGVTWHYTRSKAVTLQSSMGSIGFGRGTEPETHIHFETENARLVNKFTIEAASAHDQAKMTIKVGDTVYMDEKVVPRAQYDTIGTITTDEVTPASGKIEIDVVTPEYDAYLANNDPQYQAPGAFYLKSILINFGEALPDKTMSLVKDSSDIVAGGRYLIVGQYNNGFSALDGTLGSGTKDNPLILTDDSVLGDFELTDSVTIPGNFDKYGFVASFDENDKLNFTSDTGIKIGLSGGGSLSTTKSPALLGWDYSLDENNKLIMSMEDTEETPKTKYFGVNKTSGKFSAYADAAGSSQGSVYLYKF